MPRSIDYLFIVFICEFRDTLQTFQWNPKIDHGIQRHSNCERNVWLVFFFINNAVRQQENLIGVYFKHASLKQLKPVSIGFAPVAKNYALFAPNLNVKRFWKCNIFEYAVYWSVGINKLKRHAQTGSV